MEVSSLKAPLAIFMEVPKSIENAEVGQMFPEVAALDTGVNLFQELEEGDISNVLSAHLEYILGVYGVDEVFLRDLLVNESLGDSMHLLDQVDFECFMDDFDIKKILAFCGR